MTEKTFDVQDAVRQVLDIVKLIVDHPDDVEVNIRPGKYRMAVELYTNPKDVGQVVGRSGHICSSIRSLLSALAGKSKMKIDLDYVTEEDNKRARGEIDSNEDNFRNDR